jgi:hypothetical protein
MKEMNINGLDGKFVVGGWCVEVNNDEEFEDLQIFLDQSDLVELNIDFQNGNLKVINLHAKYPDHEIVQASDKSFYAVRYGGESEFYKTPYSHEPLEGYIMEDFISGERKYNSEMVINSLVKERKAIVLNLDSAETSRWNPLEVEGQRIPIKNVIDSDGNVIPYELVPEESNITKEHWQQISNLVQSVDKETLKILRNDLL